MKSRSFRLWVLATALISIFSAGGYRIASEAIVRNIAGSLSIEEHSLGLEAYSIGLIGFVAGGVGFLFGLVVATIILHRLGRRWKVSVFRPTLFGFLTFLLLLFLYILYLGR